MVDQIVTQADKPSFATGTVVKNQGWLWRVDAQEGNVLVATAIDTGEPGQLKFCTPFEEVRPGKLEPPSPDIVGHIAAQQLLLRAYRLSLLHGTAPRFHRHLYRVGPAALRSGHHGGGRRRDVGTVVQE